MKRITILLAALLISVNAHAAFVDWWLSPDQQARIAFEKGDYPKAAQLFEDPLWKGLAFYASQDFASAAMWFSRSDSAFGNFYLGNSLAHQDLLAESIAAYEDALLKQPNFEEAQFNLKWVSGLYELSLKEYDDHGGTGGKLGADSFVFDDRAKDSEQTMSSEEAASQGLTDAQIEDIWMRRVQTTPADFLEFKFSYQLQTAEEEE